MIGMTPVEEKNQWIYFKFVSISHIVPHLADDGDGGPPRGTSVVLSVVLSVDCDPGCLTRLCSLDSLDDKMNRW